jgi:hypothetical protein
MKKLLLIPIILLCALLHTHASDIGEARKLVNTQYSAALGQFKSDPAVKVFDAQLKQLNSQMREVQEAAGLVNEMAANARSEVFKKLKGNTDYRKWEGERSEIHEQLKTLLVKLDPEYKVAVVALNKLLPKSQKQKKLPGTQTKLTQSIGRSAYVKHDPVFDRATTLWFRYPAGSWLEALPIGNGSFGAMIFGGVTDDVVQFNHDTLWTAPDISKDIVDNAYPSKEAEIAKIRAMIFAGQEPEAHAYSRENVLHKYDVGAYQPLGELLFKYDFGGEIKKEAIKGYNRNLDMETGVASVRFELEGTTYEREVFVADDGDVIIVRMSATGPGSISTDMNFSRPAHFEHQKPVTQSLGSNMITLSGKAHGDKASDIATSYQAVALATTTGGEVSSKDGVISVRNAKEMVITISGATNYNAENPFKPLPTNLQAQCVERSRTG